jgi:hypothetical protein
MMNHTDSPQESLHEGSACRKAATYTGQCEQRNCIQRGPKKCSHTLSAAITPVTLTAVFAQQFGGIDAVSPLMVVTSNTYNDSLSLRARIVTTCHFVPKY